jgi:hypothetical protein
MKIKIYASVKKEFPTPGPYKKVDVVERDSPYQVGDKTHYGEVILLLPSIVWLNDAVEQGVVVKLDPASVGTWCEESVMEKPPTSYDKIQFFPISGACAPWSLEAPLAGPYQILPSENLSIENVSALIKPETFSLWKKGCDVSKNTAESLDCVKFAIVRRHKSPDPGDGELETYSTLLLDYASSCLALIRPTRRSRAMHIRGVIKPDGGFDPYGFTAREDLADVPEIQKLFVVREQDVQVLTSVLPEFIELYQEDENGKLTDDYEPLRMAVQLYGEGYALSYWKARHILWCLLSKPCTETTKMLRWQESILSLAIKACRTDTSARSTKREISRPASILPPIACIRSERWFRLSTRCVMLLLTGKRFQTHTLSRFHIRSAKVWSVSTPSRKPRLS